MSVAVLGLALHGGAGASRDRDYARERTHMRGLVERGRDALRHGVSALDVATDTVAALEASGLYIAGRGASPNREGRFELDASIVDGATGTAGAVAGLEGFLSPVRVARRVMQETPHVLLVGAGAAAFARRQGLPSIPEPGAWFRPAGLDEANSLDPADGHGTVGCVVLDVAGRLAAATSTGGVFGKMPGRCGDSALVGAGSWADARVAVSCTGQGEFFIRVAAAAQVAHRLRWAGQGVAEAADATLAEVVALGGHGGLIAIDAGGRVAMPFRSSGMKRAALRPDGGITVETF